MDYRQLDRGKKIDDEKKDLQRVLDHLQKWESGKTDPIEFVSEYLTRCQMVGNGTIRKTLAIGFITDSITYLETKIKMLSEEFESL